MFYQSKLIENRNVLADSDLQCNAIVYCIKVYLDGKAHNATQSVMDWPPKSPNINCIKATWDNLNRTKPSSHLKEALDTGGLFLKTTKEMTGKS